MQNKFFNIASLGFWFFVTGSPIRLKTSEIGKKIRLIFNILNTLK